MTFFWSRPVWDALSDFCHRLQQKKWKENEQLVIWNLHFALNPWIQKWASQWNCQRTTGHGTSSKLVVSFLYSSSFFCLRLFLRAVHWFSGILNMEKKRHLWKTSEPKFYQKILDCDYLLWERSAKPKVCIYSPFIMAFPYLYHGVLKTTSTSPSFLLFLWCTPKKVATVDMRDKTVLVAEK